MSIRTTGAIRSPAGMPLRRRLRHVKVTRVFVTAVVVLGALTACGDGKSDAGPAEPSGPVEARTSAEASQTPTPSPTPSPTPDVETFPSGLTKDVHIADPNGYEAVVHEEISEWVTLTAAQAQELCGADELLGVSDSSVIHARRTSFTASFPTTDLGDWSNGGSNILVELITRPQGSDVGDGQVVCRSDRIHPDDYYAFQGTAKMYFDASPSEPDARMTVFRIVPKTPNNPDGEMAPDAYPVGHVLIGAISDPERILPGLFTGRTDDFETYYTKFGYLGDDGGEGDPGYPDGGTIQPDTTEPAS